MFLKQLNNKLIKLVSIGVFVVTCQTASAELKKEDLIKKADGLDEEVLSLALDAYHSAKKQGHIKKNKLAIIDYSKPSSERRLWIFDLDKKEVTHNLHVAHGSKSGLHESNKFSNNSGSHQTSLGVFVTQETYQGRNGYSLRLSGLEKGVNDKARSRAIVMHGANYAKPEFIKANGRLGRSQGCPAIDPRVSKEVIDHIKGGSMIFAYYPDQKWLSQSKFL